MAAWSDVGAVAVGGGIGVVGTYIGTRLQVASLRSERQAADHAARVARVAEVLGPIATLLIDLLPARALTRFHDLASLGADHTGRWLPLREKWEILIVQEPDSDTRGAMRHLEVAIENLYSRLGLALTPAAQSVQDPDRTWFDQAVEHHEEAVHLADEIAGDLHQRGNIGATRPAETTRDAETSSEADSAE